MRIQFVRWRLIITILIFGSLSISFPGRASAWSDTDISLVDSTESEAVRLSFEETSGAVLSENAPVRIDQPLSKQDGPLTLWQLGSQAAITETGAVPYLSFRFESDPGSMGHPGMVPGGLNGSTPGSKLTLLDVPPAPILLSPANESILNNLIPVLEIDTGIPETSSSPRIELSLSPQFTAGQTTATIGCGGMWGHFDTYESPGSSGFPGLQGESGNLLPGTRFYWRARTAYGNACGVPSTEWGPWSDVYSFVTGSGGAILPGPQLLNPPDGDPAAELRPMFSWQPDSGALGMSLQVQGVTPGAGGWGLTSFNCPRTEYQPDWDLTPGASYQWRVFYRNEYAWGEPSIYWTFSVSLASLAIAGRVLDTTGSGIPGVIISDNAGHSATTGDTGEYRLDHLSAGTYTITPNRSGYVFCPAARAITIPPNATEQDFIGAISGGDPCPGRIYLTAILYRNPFFPVLL